MKQLLHTFIRTIVINFYVIGHYTHTRCLRNKGLSQYLQCANCFPCDQILNLKGHEIARKTATVGVN